MPRDGGKDGGKALGLHHAGLLNRLVDRHRRHTSGKFFDCIIQIFGGDGFRHQPHISSLAPGNHNADEQHAFDLFRAQPVHPHHRNRAAPDPGRHVADLGLTGHNRQVRT